MGLGGFFKKKDDSAPDFNFGQKQEGGEPEHFGLPPDGDMAATGSQNEGGGSPFGGSLGKMGMDAEGGPSQPAAFDRLQQMSLASEQYTQEGARQLAKGEDHPAASEGTGRFSMMEKDLQIINAKMDSLKNFMESINQRLLHIERIAEESRQKEEKVRW